MAAVFAGRAGAEVTVLEKNEKAGKKLYLTGKGRCNVTNDCTMEEFLREVPRNSRFLYSALNFFSPQDLIALLEENGCPVEVQRGRRAYPRSMKASDVTRTLVSVCRRQGVRFLLNTSVDAVLAEDGAVSGVRLEDGTVLPADRVILACGGLSYPATGSTGDGYRMAQALGHTVTTLLPSLIGLESEEAWPRELQGLSLKNVRVTLRQGKKILYTEQGEMLFTHFGFSGPLILEASCHLPDRWPGGATGEESEGGITGKESAAELELDLKPGLTREQLDARLLRDLEAGGKKQLRNLLPGLLPGRLAGIFPELCGLPEDLPCNQVTSEQRENLVNHLKGLALRTRRRRPVAEAVVTRGGIPVKEVRPGTMESRLIAGLYFAGEMLDVDAHTGGYNLQTAFSTGALAGDSAGRDG